MIKTCSRLERAGPLGRNWPGWGQHSLVCRLKQQCQPHVAPGSPEGGGDSTRAKAQPLMLLWGCWSCPSQSPPAGAHKTRRDPAFWFCKVQLPDLGSAGLCCRGVPGAPGRVTPTPEVQGEPVSTHAAQSLPRPHLGPTWVTSTDSTCTSADGRVMASGHRLGESFVCSLTFQGLQQLGWVRLSLELHLGLPCGRQGPSSGTALCGLPRSVSRELAWRCRSWTGIQGCSFGHHGTNSS